MNAKFLVARKLLASFHPADEHPVYVSSGCLPLDRLLPGQGFQRGSLVEWLGNEPGSGASLLAMLAARQACEAGGALVIVDRPGTFYPPAAAACHIDLQHTIVVRPETDRDERWALDQALRCPQINAVVAWPQQLDSHTFRRLQLATEQSGSLGLFLRPASAQREPSWASVRMLVSPCTSQRGWNLRIELLRCRGSFARRTIEVEIDNVSKGITSACAQHQEGRSGNRDLFPSHLTGEVRDAHPCPMVPELASAAIDSHQARA